jgi:hypothetical protein
MSQTNASRVAHASERAEPRRFPCPREITFLCKQIVRLTVIAGVDKIERREALGRLSTRQLGRRLSRGQLSKVWTRSHGSGRLGIQNSIFGASNKIHTREFPTARRSLPQKAPAAPATARPCLVSCPSLIFEIGKRRRQRFASYLCVPERQHHAGRQPNGDDDDDDDDIGKDGRRCCCCCCCCCCC